MSATPLRSGTTPARARRLGLGALAATGAVGLLLAGCGGSSNAFSSSSSSSSSAGGSAAASGGGNKNLVVGGADFTEMRIMQQLYGQLLTKAGYTIQYKAVTNREVYEPALEKGQIDVVPEYAATMADFMNTKINGSTAPSIASPDPQTTLNKLKPLLQQKGLRNIAGSVSESPGFSRSASGGTR